VIYAIRCSGSSHIKFGKAKNPKRRLDMLQTGNPSQLQLIAWADWPDSEEWRIHQFLEQDWVRGEWFARSALANRVIELLRDGEAGLEVWKNMRGVRARSPYAPDYTNSRLAKVIQFAHEQRTNSA